MQPYHDETSPTWPRSPGHASDERRATSDGRPRGKRLENVAAGESRSLLLLLLRSRNENRTRLLRDRRADFSPDYGRRERRQRVASVTPRLCLPENRSSPRKMSCAFVKAALYDFQLLRLRFSGPTADRPLRRLPFIHLSRIKIPVSSLFLGYVKP